MIQKEPIADANNVEFFADGVTAVMPMGEITHVIFHHRQSQTSEGGKVYRMVQARMIVPLPPWLKWRAVCWPARSSRV